MDPAPANPKKLSLILAGCLIAFMVAAWFINRAVNPPMEPEQALAGIAIALNQKLPLQVNPESRWLTAEYVPPRTMLYQYNLVNLTAAEVPADMVEKMRQELLEDYRHDPNLANFRKWRVTMIYRYTDKTNALITEIILRPEDL